ncbi:hypothetical protein Cni_G16114 [Canna indica]|uniref:Uncharacterized protein n=1 Tax=Canna indica TaxID=4628 RepID=A0AAQ3KI48_9LILI|nr:hypothetical protein Cni_G16114 [Canna indica]
MEETKPSPSPAVQTSSIPNPAAAVAEAPNARSNKRKADADEFRNSDYFKLRLLVKNLRPLFVEVLRAPDFPSSNVVHDIQNHMKTMCELAKKIRGDVASSENCEKPSKVESSSKVKNEEPLTNLLESAKPKAEPEVCHTSTVTENKTKSEQVTSTVNVQDTASPEIATEVKEKAKQLDEAFQGTYVIGGSKLGWNFLVYPGNEPVYYGVTKESALALRAAKS